MAEINDELIRRVALTIQTQNRLISELNDLLRTLSGRFERQGEVLGSIDKTTAVLAERLDRVQDDVHDLTPTYGVRLENAAVPRTVEPEQSWKHQVAGAVGLGKRVWPYAKWVIHGASALGGGTIIARLLLAAFGRR